MLLLRESERRRLAAPDARTGREGSVRASAGITSAFDSKQEGADGNRRPQASFGLFAGSTTTATEPVPTPPLGVSDDKH